jgi:hypothetical protein
MEIIPLLLLVLVCCALLFGYPVAFTLSGVSILFALICIPLGIFDESILKSIPLRIFGIMNNVTLLAVPLFIFMGTVLERSGIASKMLENMALAFKNIRGGLSISIIAVGALLAASTGIVEMLEPPLIFLKASAIFSSIFDAMPDRSSTVPIKINSGTASKVTLFIMPNILKGILFKIDSSNIPSGIQIRANKIETPERVNATG